MKGLVIVWGMIFSISAWGVSPWQVCEQLTFDSNRSECMQVVNSGYVSEGAAGVCARTTFDSGAVECLRASLDKEYAPAELRICADSSFDSGIVSCMQASGRSLGRDRGEPGRCRVNESRRFEKIRRLARKIKRQIERGRYERARENAERIIDLTDFRN